MLNDTFRAFKNRNFSLFFIGQSISQIGTWMQRTAVVWLLYTMSHSATMIGVAVFAQQFPSFLLSLFGGVIADRHSRFKILIITQTASMIQAALLTGIILSGRHNITLILTLGVLLGIINAFDVPARQPMIHEMVDDQADLANANSINTAMVNLARMIGPALSGFMLQHFGAGVCFLLNALSFIAVIGSLLMMNLPKKKQAVSSKDMRSELADGYRYLVETKSIGLLILLVTTVSFFIMPYDVLEPVFAKAVLKGDSATFGYLSGCIGLGALAGSFMLAALKKGINLRKMLFFSLMLFGLALILFSYISSVYSAILLGLFLGLSSILPISLSVSLILLEVSPIMRGRVTGYLAMAYFGMLPLGSLLIGNVSEKIGPEATMFGQGIAAFMVAAGFYKTLMHPQASQRVSSKRY